MLINVKQYIQKCIQGAFYESAQKFQFLHLIHVKQSF